MAVIRAVSAPIAEADLLAIFGPANGELDPRARARSSRERFVRSHTGLARWSEGAGGQVISAYQALDTFGWEVLNQLIDKPVAPIARAGADAATAIRKCREHAGVTVQQLAAKAGVANADVEAAEAGRRRVPMKVLSQIAQALALSPSAIGVGINSGGDPGLGVRFRQLRDGRGGFTPTIVLGLMEAAWVISEQCKLEAWINQSRILIPSALGFRPISVRQTIYPPAYRQGMDLASRTRELLGISFDSPIKDLLPKVEGNLSIPVVQINLSSSFVGATIENGGARGIAVNVGGINENVWTRRMTVAHELGHYLWDPSDQLDRLRVDGQEDIESNARELADPVEIRANAFAAEFLAPQQVVTRLYDEAGGGPSIVSDLMDRYGVSFTALKWQLHNGSNGRIDQSTLRSRPGTVPSDAWKADEGRRIDYFPFPKTSFVRRGRFAELCVAATDANLITKETLASYLGVELDELISQMDTLRSLIGSVPPDPLNHVDQRRAGDLE